MSDQPADGALRVDVRGPAELTVQLTPGSSKAPRSGTVRPLGASGGGTSWRAFEVIVDGWRFEVTVEPARQADLRERAARAAAEHGPHGATTLRAQIPGRVTRVWVEAGAQVEAGQRLLAVEAMKMENEVRAPRPGEVTAVLVEPGAKVERNDPLVELA